MLKNASNSLNRQRICIKIKKHILTFILAILIIFLFTNSSYARYWHKKPKKKQTIISEDITRDTVWNYGHSPYIITKTIRVQGTHGYDRTTTLKMTPGTIVKFEPGASLIIGGDTGDPGALIVMGNWNRNVLFTSNQSSPNPGDWGAVVFKDTANEHISFFSNGTVEYGGYGDKGSLWLDKANIRTLYSTFQYSSNQGVYVSHATPLISQNDFLHNDGPGLSTFDCSPLVSGNNIKYNNYGVEINQGSTKVSGNQIYNNAHGIHVLDATPELHGNNLFWNNIGIFEDHSSSIITGNTILYSKDKGMHIANDSNSLITGNNITYSETYGIYCIDATSHPTIKLNNIIGNGSYPIRVGAMMNVYQNVLVGNGINAIEVIGEIVSSDTRWHNEHVPYVITGDISVFGTDSNDGMAILTFTPGIQLRFDDHYILSIGQKQGEPGALVSKGYNSKHIHYTSNKKNPAPGDWSAIHFYNTADKDKTIFQNNTVEYGGFGNTGNIYFEESTVKISKSNIKKSISQGVMIKDGSPTIKDNRIYTNNQGISINGSTATIKNNKIYQNTVQGIFLSNNSTPEILANNIYKNGTYGIYSIDASSHPLITDNTITENGSYPIRVGAMMTVYGNTLLNNGKNAIEVIGEVVTADTTWHNEKVDYVPIGDIFVQGSDANDGIAVLKIKPDLTIRFNGHYSLNIGQASGDSGALMLLGSETEPSLFTSDQIPPAPGDWSGIYFHNTADESLTIFDHCTVEFGGEGDHGNIWLNNTRVEISDTIIQKSLNHGIHIESGSPIVINNKIHNNNIGLSIINSHAKITTNEIATNIQHGVFLKEGAPEIQQNTIQNNGAYGIYSIDNTSHPLIKANTITNNGSYPIRIGGMMNVLDNIMTANGIQAIEVIGEIISHDTLWQNQQVPFVPIGDITVFAPDTSTLTIEADTTIKFNGSYNMIIGKNSGDSGALDLLSNNDHPIIFTSDKPTPAPGDWGAIQFLHTTSLEKTNFRHAIVEYGGAAKQANIYLEDTNLTIENVISQKSIESGIYLNKGDPKIRNSRFTDNTTHGVQIAVSGDPIIHNNQIDHNQSHGIFSSSEVSYLDMQYNSIENNGTYPIRTSPMMEIRNNTYTANGTEAIEICKGTVSKDMIWYDLNKPYVLVGNVIIGGNDGKDKVSSLNINPGSLILFNKNTSIQAGINASNKGVLIADATDAKPIHFTSSQVNQTPGDWDGLIFSNYSDDRYSIVKNCIVEYGGAIDGNIKIINANTKIINSLIRKSKKYGIYVSSGSPFINSNRIKENLHSGIYYTGTGKPKIKGNSIYANTSYGIYRNSGGKITAEYNWWDTGTGPKDTVNGPDGLYNPSGTGDRVSENVDYDPWLEDNDNDGIPDLWEDHYFGGTDNSGANTDSDGDAVSDADEFDNGTDPTDPDNDNDGLSDACEILYFHNTQATDDPNEDTDGDGYSNLIECIAGSDPTNPNDKPKAGTYYEYDKIGRIKGKITVE